MSEHCQLMFPIVRSTQRSLKIYISCFTQCNPHPDNCAHHCSGNSDFALTCKQRGCFFFFTKGKGSLFSRIAPTGLTAQVGRTCLLQHPGGFHPCRELQPGLAQNPSSGCWCLLSGTKQLPQPGRGGQLAICISMTTVDLP